MNTPRSLFKRLCGALLLSLSVSAMAAMPGPGDVPPDTLGQTLKGEPVRLSQYEGKAVVVSFWASWCGYCMKELPILFNIQKAAKGRLQVVAINAEDVDMFRDLTRAMRDLDIGMAYDPDGLAQKAYGVNGIPHMVIIGRDGKIVQVFRGYGESSLKPIVAAINSAIGARQ